MTIDLQFEWDEAKRLANLRKHGLNFAEVGSAFIDPDRIIYTVLRNGLGEERQVIIGKVGHRVVHIVFTMRGELIRLISARQAHVKERSLYERGKNRPSSVH